MQHPFHGGRLRENRAVRGARDELANVGSRPYLEPDRPGLYAWEQTRRAL
jgi:hypothetical protein